MKGRLFLTVNVITYIIFIFITLEISPFAWSDLSRLIYVIFVFLAYGRASQGLDDVEDNEK